MIKDFRTTKRRQRNAPATRSRILAVATEHFTKESFDGVGLRQIAAEAGVDVALIARYFGSKENLFQEVLSSTLSPNNWVGVERETFGQDMVDAVSGLHASSPITDYYLLLIRAATTPFTLSVLHRLVDERIFEPFVEWVGGEDARLRTKLLLTFISGMNIHALVASGSKMLEGEDMKRFRRISADFIQRIVDGDIEMLLKGDALPASVSRSANG